MKDIFIGQTAYRYEALVASHTSSEGTIIGKAKMATSV